MEMKSLTALVTFICGLALKPGMSNYLLVELEENEGKYENMIYDPHFFHLISKIFINLSLLLSNVICIYSVCKRG